MSGGLNRFAVAALVAGVLLAAPTAAYACSGGPSAENVYSECLPTGGGSKPTSGKSGTTGPTAKPLPVSKQLRRKLAHAGGRDKGVLYRLVANPELRASRGLEPGSPTASSAPSALGSAFDLGSGPTALLAILAGTAVLLLGASGWRGWRRWHR